MTVTRRMTIGFMTLLVWVIILIAVGATMLIWINSWQSGLDRAIARVEAATEIELKAIGMAGYNTGWTEVSLAAVAQDEQSRNQEITYLGAEGTTLVQKVDQLLSTELIGEENIATLGSIRSLASQYMSAVNEVFTLALSDSAAAYAKLTNDVYSIGQELQTASGTLWDNAKANQAAELDSLSKTGMWMMIIMAVVGAFAIVAALITSVQISRTIKRNLNEAASSIGASASELLAIASQVSAGATQTAASTNETTATVEEVKQTAQLAQEKALEVAESSQSVAQSAQAGRNSVDDAITAFERVQAQMGMVSESITRLSDQTQAVGDIISTVNDIAEQSNLLSVNASIEAAKAGEQGKGFIVVAQEVKSLAEQSKQAVAQVRNILSEIQKASEMAVQSAQLGNETIDESRRMVETAGQNTQALADSAGEAAQSATQISASSRQQLAGMEQISQAIESINQASSRSVSGTRQVEQEVKNLQDLARGLKRLVDAKDAAQAAPAISAKTTNPRRED